MVQSLCKKPTAGLKNHMKKMDLKQAVESTKS